MVDVDQAAPSVSRWGEGRGWSKVKQVAGICTLWRRQAMGLIEIVEESPGHDAEWQAMIESKVSNVVELERQQIPCQTDWEREFWKDVSTLQEWEDILKKRKV
jgi:hypothetical protein